MRPATPATVSSADDCPAPLPPGVVISPPSAAVPAEVARFSGRWGNGRWYNMQGELMCAALAVTHVREDGSVRAICSWGSLQKTHHNFNLKTDGGHSYVSGTIDNGVLYLNRFPNGAVVKYWFDGETLSGMYARRG